jgi:plastocyanin
MSRRRLGTALVAAIAGLALAVAPGTVLAGPDSGTSPSAEVAKKKKKTPKLKVKVGDDFFSPAKAKVKKGTKVKWKWLDSNFNSHNVTLRKGPKSLKKKDKKKLKSGTAVINYKFAAKLKKAGKYKFVCTIHSTVMKQTIKVKK